MCCLDTSGHGESVMVTWAPPSPSQTPPLPSSNWPHPGVLRRDPCHVLVHGWGGEQATRHLGSWSDWWFCPVAGEQGRDWPMVGGRVWVSRGCGTAHLPGSSLNWSLCHFPILCWFCSCCCDLCPIPRDWWPQTVTVDFALRTIHGGQSTAGLAWCRPTPVPGPVPKSRHHISLGLQHFEQRGAGAWGCKVGLAGGFWRKRKRVWPRQAFLTLLG